MSTHLILERVRRASWRFLATAAMLLSLSCGGSSGSNADPTSTPPALPPAVLAGAGPFQDLDQESLAACLEEAGLDIDTQAGPGDLLDPEMDPATTEALSACASEQGVTLPEGFPEGGPIGGGGRADTFLDIDPATVGQCLRDAGIEVTDEAISGDMPGVLASLDRTNTEVQAAIATCLGPGGQ